MGISNTLLVLKTSLDSELMQGYDPVEDDSREAYNSKLLEEVNDRP